MHMCYFISIQINISKHQFLKDFLESSVSRYPIVKCGLKISPKFQVKSSTNQRTPSNALMRHTAAKDVAGGGGEQDDQIRSLHSDFKVLNFVGKR